MKEVYPWGHCPQTPGILRFDAIPDVDFIAGVRLSGFEPQLGLGPGVGAQVASQQCPHGKDIQTIGSTVR